MSTRREADDGQAGTQGVHGPKSRIRRYWFDVLLWKRILLALACGAALGMLIGDQAAHIKWIGDIFLRLIRMVIAPLVLVAIISAITGMGDIRRLGTIGGKTLALYFCLTLSAVSLGLLVGSLVGPGFGIDFGSATPRQFGPSRDVGEQLMGIIPTNPIAALAEGNIQAIIFFGILFGVSVLILGESARPLRDVLQAAADAMLVLVRIVMEFAPFGVFALAANVFGSVGLAAFYNVFLLGICVLVGCAFQTLVVHGSLVRFVAGMPVVPFFRDITDAVAIAFSTSSSSAVLPVAMRVAEKNLGVSPTVASTTLPLGTTLSMDGTAFYVSLLAVFSAQAFGVHLGVAEYGLLALASMIVMLGMAPVAGGALLMLGSLVQVIGIGADQAAIVVGFLLPFDRLFDMIRTIPSATSDLSVVVTVANWEGELDHDVYLRRPVE